MRFLMFLLFSLFACTCVRAQTHETLALEAYLSSDVKQWDAAIDATSALTDEKIRLLTRAEYELGKAYAAMVTRDEDSCDAAIEAVDELLDRLWEITETDAAAHGLYSGLLGLKIARRPITGMIYGLRAARYAREGVALDADDPAALYHAAGNSFYTPEQWGGDPEQALTYLQHAVTRYGTDRDQNYRYLATLALLGQVQAKLGMVGEARATYDEALIAQPGFNYVSKVLLPRLEK